jgi:acyl phosphate:glycerol-3-phosphate acyltransferase
MTGLIAIVFAYLVGSIPFGYILTRFTTGKDVRESGSGNIGATNVLRTAGRGPAIATLVLDITKGYLAVFVAGLLTQNNEGWMANAALAVMVGHAFPVFLKFKGGKTVATFIGAFGCLTPVPLLAAMLVFLITVAVTRYISLGSILAAATFPLGVWLILHPSPTVVLAALISAAFIVYRHRPNVERIRAGTEPEFRWRIP